MGDVTRKLRRKLDSAIEEGKLTKENLKRELARARAQASSAVEDRAAAKEMHHRYTENSQKLHDLQAEHHKTVDAAARLAKKLSQLSLEHEEMRVEYVAYQERHCEMAKRLERIEAAGLALLEFIPSEATGRARFSKHARAAVAFREALGSKEGKTR